MATKEYLDKRSGERNVDSRIQVQLHKDGSWRRQHKTELDGDKWSTGSVNA